MSIPIAEISWEQTAKILTKNKSSENKENKEKPMNNSRRNTFMKIMTLIQNKNHKSMIGNMTLNVIRKKTRMMSMKKTNVWKRNRTVRLIKFMRKW